MKKSYLFLALFAFPYSATAAQTELSTQTVKADFRHTHVQQLPEATTVVGSEQIDARSAEHLEQILSVAPNVNFSSGSSRRSEEHTSELQSRPHLVCRLLL